MVACTTQIVILTSLARKDLSEVQPYWLAQTVIEALKMLPWTGGSVTERLRGRLVPYRNCFPFSLLLLFCGVKREAKNPFEIETRGSISPQDTHGPYRTAPTTWCKCRRDVPQAPFAKRAMDPLRAAAAISTIGAGRIKCSIPYQLLDCYQSARLNRP